MTWSPSEPKKVTACQPLDTRGPKRLWDAPSGWVMRTRGADGGTRPMEFCCPVHGRFEVDVPRGEDPDAVACGREDVVSLETYPPQQVMERCGLSSPWSPSSAPAIWPSAGEVTS